MSTSLVAQAQDNEPPTIESIPLITVNEGTGGNYQVIADDDDEDELSFDLENEPGFVSINPVTGLLSYDPGEEHGPKDYTFTVVVYDGTDYATRNVTIRVREVNVAPDIDLPDDSFTVQENESIWFDFRNYTYDPDLKPTFNGIQSQTLTFSATGLPSGATLKQNGEFYWTPSESQGGMTFNGTLRVSDGVTSDTAQLSVYVEEDNQCPELATISDRIVQVNKLVSFTAKATDSDLPKQTISYHLENEPSGATINSSTGAFTWTPTVTGEYCFRVVAEDSEGCEDGQWVNIIVVATSNPKPSGKVLFTVEPYYLSNVYVGAKFRVYNGTNLTLRNVRVNGTYRGQLTYGYTNTSSNTVSVSGSSGYVNLSAGCFDYKQSNNNLFSTFVWDDFNVKPGESECLEMWVRGPSLIAPYVIYGPAYVNFVADGVAKPPGTQNIYTRYPAIDTFNMIN